MATKTLRVGAGNSADSFGALFESDQAAANRSDGWTSAKIATTNMSNLDTTTKQASGTFTTSLKPGTTLLTGATANAFVAGPFSGTFANTAWTFTFALRCSLASSQRGRMNLQMFRGSAADGSDAATISGRQIGSTVAAALSTTVDQTSVVSWSPGVINLDNEYLFFALAWEITTAGGSNSADVLIRTGQSAGGSRLVTSDLVLPQAVPIGDVPSTTVVRGATLAASGAAPVAIGRVSGAGGGVSYSATVLADNPVSYWRLGSAATAHDEKGVVSDAAVGGGTSVPGLLSGDSDTAVDFDGSVGVGVAFSDTAAHQITSGSWEAWVKTAGAGSGYRAVLSKETISGIFLKDNEVMTYDWSGPIDRLTGVFVNDNARHHVVLQFQSGVVNGSRFYVDGVAVGSPFTQTLTGTTSVGVKIGFNGTVQQIDATIDEVALYNSVLSPAQIASHYNAGITGGGTGTTVRGLTPVGQGTPIIIIGSKAGATTVRGVNLSGLFVMPLGRRASTTVVSGTTLVAAGAATIVVGKKASATVVRGVTPVGVGTVAFTIGSRVAATTVRGATLTGTGTVPITIGKRAAATTVRGVEVKPPEQQIPIGYVPSYASYGDGGYGELPYGGTGVWGVTLTLGPPGFTIGRKTSATVVRGVTPAAVGTVQLVIGRKTLATAVRGATVVAAGAANLVIGRKTSATTVRGATLAATGTANLVIGRKASATTVRGATVVAAGAAPITIGKSASTTVVRGATVTATGAANIVIGKKLVNTTVRGATVAATGAVTVLSGRVAAATTVRGVSVVSLLINVPIGRVTGLTTVRGATVAATGAVTIIIGRRATTTAVRGLTLAPAGITIVIGNRAAATTVRGTTLVPAGAAPIVIGRKASATVVRGATVVPAGAAVVILGRKASATTVRGATLAVAGAAPIIVGRVATATAVRGTTLTATGEAPIVLGKRAAATTVRGLLLAPGVATVPIGRVGGAPALSVTSGLAIHFDASVLGLADGADVTSWTNLANGSLPGAMLGTPLPTLRANALTGKAVVRFTHDNGRVRMTGTGIAADWTLLYVGRLWGTVPGRVVTGIYSPSNILLGYWTTFENVHYDNGFGARTNELPWTTDWKLYSADGTSSLTRSRSFNNGIPMDTVLTAQGWGGTFAISGYDPTGLQETADCEVAEVLMYNRQLGGTERQTVEAYLRTKWIVGGGGTSVRGVTLVPSTVGIPVAKISSTTTVRGIAGLTTSAIVIGKKASTTVVGGIQLTTITPSNVLIGRRVSTTVVRGTSLAVAGSAPIVLGRRAVATTVRGTTLVGAGTVGLAIGRKLNATVVRGTTLAAGGIVNLPIGVRASVTTVRGTTLVHAGEVTLPIGKRVAVTTVRGVTPAAVGTAGLTIGRRASVTAVKGATVSGSGTPTIIIGRRAAATTVRGLTTAPGVVQVPIGRRLSTTLVRGIGIVVTGAAPITLGRVIGLTTVIGVSLVPGATVVYLGYRAAFTTVRGLVLAEFGVAYVIPRFVGVYQEPAILLSVSPANGETPIQNFIVDEPRITGVGTYDDEIAPPDYVPDKPHLTGVS